MIAYQRVLYLRGTMTGVLLLIGLAAVIRRLRGGGFRRRRMTGAGPRCSRGWPGWRSCRSR